ncbi:hypothetical protein BD410DRAFT_817836 [Rickenella mellea]|uniref:SWR1-complex protein 4 n=1 Tax=Rickenella mellea TaxID=50990 RepID=A0A4R5XFG2_9AGAM|nr:hypothetical protein BD410DRAFT_817836 [Rickenella mellea]
MAGGASAADVRSILALPSPSTPGPSQPKPTAPKTARKPEGISRELYSLIGPSAPSLTAQLAKPRLKQKPNLGRGNKVAKWRVLAFVWRVYVLKEEWQEFSNPGRADSLKLCHWVKATTDPTAEYQFAKYNVPSTVYTYSQDEYNRLLEDKDWTKEETDYLFNVVREYDLRFYVVADRYDYPGGQPRTIEDLKDRYYSVCRRLIRNRPWAGDESSKVQLVASFFYDKDREVTRKKYIASLENRTPDQIAEEEALYVEVKRLEQNERRFAKERDELLKTIAGVDSGLPGVAADDEVQIALFGDPKKKKKGGNGMDIDSPISGPSGIISLGPSTPTRRVQSAKSVAYDALHCILRSDVMPTNVPPTKAAHQPVYLRSSRLPMPKASMAPKINQALAELDVSHTRLVMPTRENCSQLEGLFDAAAALVDTKKVVDKVDQEIRVLKARLAGRASVGARSEGADADSKNQGEQAEDGERDAEGEAEGEATEKADRAVSVAASVRSYSRKRSKRSASVSSVDTSTTSATRASRKRQRN